MTVAAERIARFRTTWMPGFLSAISWNGEEAKWLVTSCAGLSSAMSASGWPICTWLGSSFSLALSSP